MGMAYAADTNRDRYSWTILPIGGIRGQGLHAEKVDLTDWEASEGKSDMEHGGWEAAKRGGAATTERRDPESSGAFK